jgi:hypothetical protein
MASKLDGLLPAFARLLLDQHGLYLAEGLLPLPGSMAQHSGALLRYSRLSRFQPNHVRFARAWVAAAARGQEEQQLISNNFFAECMPEILAMAKVYHKQGWLQGPGQIAVDLLDACLAEAGH